MTNFPEPNIIPEDGRFSNGPCRKHPKWKLDALKNASLGRSHRSPIAVEKLNKVITRSKQILEMPADWKLAIVPGSDTGAVEMAIWNLVGEDIGVDVLSWEAFSKDWETDVAGVLKIKNSRLFHADYGKIPDLLKVDTANRDVIFPWNGTTSGVKVPNGDWIAKDRKGLMICDATSAIFAMPLPYDKLDVVTWSWQKVLGGESSHGMLALSPRAWDAWQNREKPRPIPKLFTIPDESIFSGSTINTPSLLAVEDVLDALNWVEEIGGLENMIQRSQNNLAAMTQWVNDRDWIDFLVKDPIIRSNTSLCLEITDAKQDKSLAQNIAQLLEQKQIAYDIASYRTAPPGFRLWGGPTVSTEDLEAVMLWIEWAFHKLKK